MWYGLRVLIKQEKCFYNRIVDSNLLKSPMPKPIIKVSHLRKEFRIKQKEPGLLGGRSVFHPLYKEVKALDVFRLGLRRYESGSLINTGG
jgi:hypothetical protein